MIHADLTKPVPRVSIDAAWTPEPKQVFLDLSVTNQQNVYVRLTREDVVALKAVLHRIEKEMDSAPEEEGGEHEAQEHRRDRRRRRLTRRRDR